MTGVFWAVSYDQTAENGNLKFYRGTQADPVQLITQSTIVSPNMTSAPTSPLSIGNVTTGEQAFRSPYHGSIDFVRIHSGAMDVLSSLMSYGLDQIPHRGFLHGDVDGDHGVDAQDRTIQTTNFTGELPRFMGDKEYTDGDIDADHDVDTMDQTLLLANWDGACAGPGAENISLVYQPSTGNVKTYAVEKWRSGCILV